MEYSRKSSLKWILVYLVIGLAAYGAVYYFFLNKNTENAVTPQNEQVQTKDSSETVDWETYSNNEGFEFQYPSGSMNVLDKPLDTPCYTGADRETGCKSFTSEVIKTLEMYDNDSEKVNIETYGGIQVLIIADVIDDIAIHKHDQYPLIGKSVNTAAPIIIAQHNAYEYDLVSSVNYKIHGYMIPLGPYRYIEIFENSKYPIVQQDAWIKIISTFKFTK